MSEGTKAVEEAQNIIKKFKCSKCGRKSSDFVMSRVPPKTKEEFSKFTEEEFCGDRGMAFKHLWDFYKGLLPKGNELAQEANAKAEEALTQIVELKQMVGKPTDEKKVITTVSGKRIEVGK